MQSQIEYELDVLKSGNYDQALQFIEHLVNVLVRMANALTDNEKITNRVPQQEDDNFWGYTFNFIAKVVDFELDAMYAVTYRNNQLTLLFNPKEIEKDYTVETMLEGLRHEGYHLLFNHLNVHKNLDNYMSNLAADCEINQHLEKPHKHWISREYIAELCDMPETSVKEKAGSLYYYELLNQKMPPEKRKKPKDSNQKSDSKDGKQKQSPGMCSAKHWHEAEVGQNGNYIPIDVTIKTVFENAATQAKARGSLSAHIEGAIENLNKPPQVKWQNEVKKKMGRHITGHSVVMGYRTAQGLKNKTFANRNMILYSNHSVDSSFKNFTVMDFNAILNLAKTEDVFVAGGASTYKDFLPFVDAVIRTVILKDYEGDVLAPDFHITDEMTVERIPVQNEGEPAYVVEYITLKESN